MDEDDVPRNEDPQFVSALITGVVGFFEQYGWFLIIAIVVVVYLVTKYRGTFEQWQSQREQSSYKKMDSGVVRDRMEAMERARAKMQEQLDQQAKEFAEKQQKKEEEKRKERIEDWDRHQEGKGYRSKTKATENGAQPSTSTVNKTCPPKKRLRPEYNPLMGGGSDDSARFRPAPRGGGASGGG